MIKKSIVSALIITSLTYAGMDTNPEDQTLENNVWKPSITNIKTGDSCDDGNCLDDLDCFTKDGPMYKAIRSVRKSVKKLCDKL